VSSFATCWTGNIRRTSLRWCRTRFRLGARTKANLSPIRVLDKTTRSPWGLSAWLMFLTLVLMAPALWAQAAAKKPTLVVIVNPSSPVQTLSRHQALEIFTGGFRSFPNGLAALPIDLDAASAERSEFYLTLAHKKPSDMLSYWARLTFSGHQSPPYQVSSAQMAVEMVATNPSAIAYVYRETVDTSHVKVVLEFTP